MAGSELARLTVQDNLQGILTISGFPEGKETTGEYKESEGGLSITYLNPNNSDKVIEGTVEDEHNLSWSNGTRWEEVPPEGSKDDWKKYVGAAAAGAASAGFVGNLLQKKFFKNISNAEPADYVILLDRSAKMAVLDEGK